MKKLALLLLVLPALACSLGAPAAPTALPATPVPATLPPTPVPTSVAPISDERCGNGTCEGPENAGNCPQDCPAGGVTTAPADVAPAGGSRVTYVPSAGIGDVAVRVSLPAAPRYPEGAGVVVEVATFLTGSGAFYSSLDVTTLGLIQVAYVWPGVADPSGARSDGTYDYGGEIGTQALRDVVRFAAGQIPDRDGRYLADQVAIRPLSGEVGLYAFSHPGIAAVNVLALYGDQLPQVRYLVGRENPTTDTLTAVEVGYFDAAGRPVLNPLYRYPDGYSSTQIAIEYGSVRWDADYREEGARYVGRPYFDLNGSGVPDAGDHGLGPRVPSMVDKRFYSTALLQALADNGALDAANWPADLATPEEAAALWPFRSSPGRYPDLALKSPGLKVMLVFALVDHVQPALDKPHIHQAYDGFHHTAGLWTRLNPDRAYVAQLDPDLGDASPEHPANSEPGDWLEIEGWAYPNQAGSQVLVPLAAVAEMADRTHAERWEVDLEQVLAD